MTSGQKTKEKKAETIQARGRKSEGGAGGRQSKSRKTAEGEGRGGKKGRKGQGRQDHPLCDKLDSVPWEP